MGHLMALSTRVRWRRSGDWVLAIGLLEYRHGGCGARRGLSHDGRCLGVAGAVALEAEVAFR
jgi:hypothetical protein